MDAREELSQSLKLVKSNEIPTRALYQIASVCLTIATKLPEASQMISKYLDLAEDYFAKSGSPSAVQYVQTVRSRLIDRPTSSPPIDPFEFMSTLTKVDLSEYIVAGDLVRFDESARNVLLDFMMRITNCFQQVVGQENLLVWGRP